jgi:hypothetical protein
MSKHFTLGNPSEAMIQQDVLDRTEPEVELLVAYLDGELDAKSVRQVEDRLSVEPDLREKMTSLEQTWNMLSELETISADKELVRSTMEVVTLTIEKELREGKQHSGQRKWLDQLVLVTVLFMFGVIGFQLSALIGIQKKKQLVEDIPIIQNITMYKEIDSFEFLEALSKKRVFDPVDDEAASEILLLQNEVPVPDAPVVPTEVQQP